MRIRNVFLFGAASVLALTQLGTGSLAQQSPAAASQWAYLFEYEIPPAHRAAFDAGYRRHLDWHRNAGDPIDWYGWDVVTGERLTVFVDGAFGLDNEAFDNRVDPAGDRRDFAENVPSEAIATSRRVFRHRPDLGNTEFPGGGASPFIEASWYRLSPDCSGFESHLVSSLRAYRQAERLPTAVFELVSGGERPAYLVLAATTGFSSLVNAEAAVTRCVARVYTETWRYRPDLSYFFEQ